MKHSEENPFTLACQQMQAVINVCHNWLDVAQGRPLQRVSQSSGCMRSCRLARLKPVSHDILPQSALQAVVMPATFDDLRHHGYDHQHWQLLIYSWLGHDTTMRLALHLHNRLPEVSFSLFVPDGNGFTRIQLQNTQRITDEPCER